MQASCSLDLAFTHAAGGIQQISVVLLEPIYATFKMAGWEAIGCSN